MCKLCDQGVPQNHLGSRRDFLKGSAATVRANGRGVFANHPVSD